MAAGHLAAVRAKLGELKALERTIAGFAERCEAACAGGPGPYCVILTDLANHTTPEVAPRHRAIAE